MSLIVALQAEDEGIVMVADSGLTIAATDGPMSARVAEKIKAVPGRSLIWGAVGTVSAAQHAEIALNDGPLPDEAVPLRRELAARLWRHLPAPLATNFTMLVGGVVGVRLVLLEFNAGSGGDVESTLELGGVAIAGAPSMVAVVAELVLAEHRAHRPRSLGGAALLGYMAMDAAITWTPGPLKRPIVVWIVLADGTVRPFSRGEMRALESLANSWGERRRAVLFEFTQPAGRVCRGTDRRAEMAGSRP